MIYVCSDIHGRYEMFMNMLEKINFGDKDRMYIIGDVIDRGPHPIPLLMDIFERDNITLMIGNHEHMMIQALLYNDIDEYNDWMFNGGEITERQFDILDKNIQDDILEKLENCPLIIPNLCVNGKAFYLAHASHALYPENDVLLYKDAGIQNRDRILWDRDYKDIDKKRLTYKYRTLYSQYQGTTLIIGHTPVPRCSYGVVTSDGYCRISRTRGGHLINIDCGCASGITLGCLRLDDMREFYVDRRPIPRTMRVPFSMRKPAVPHPVLKT